MKPRQITPWLLPDGLTTAASQIAAGLRFVAAPLLCGALLLTGCSERAQEMEEKVTQMQRQLDEAQKQLQTANQALANRAPAEASRSAAASSAGLPSRESLEASYAESVSEFRRKLDASLKDFRVESCTVHSIQMPTELYPFNSQLSFAFTSTGGKNFTTDIPVKADVNGKWVFPTVDEVIQRVGSAERMASAGAPPISNAPSSSSAKQAKSDQPAPYMSVDGTIAIQWPDSSSPPAASRAPAPAPSAVAAPSVAAGSPPRPPPPQPPPPASSASPIMPVDRDVHVKFPSPP